jgi:hypothetical protein
MDDCSCLAGSRTPAPWLLAFQAQVTIYAIFLCMSGACQLAQPAYIDSFGDLHQTPVYQTLADCQQAMLTEYSAGMGGLDSQGRYEMAPSMIYECRHRHVDTWQ